MSVMSLYKNCVLCPRHCGADRETGTVGYCGETSVLRLAYAGIHRGEEPPITGRGGSGTIFVSGCNLGCAFCQNFQISHGKPLSNRKPLSQKGIDSQALGRAVSTGEFAEICLALQKQGAENINIVTGSHAAPTLALGIEAARKNGLVIPVLWNSSGYEGMETLEILSGFVDVYLPDLKTMDSNFAARYFNAPDYPENAARAILKMMEYRKLQFQNDTMVSGVMVRHLIIPGHLEMTRQVLKWFSEKCKLSLWDSSRALLSLMTQYTPVQTLNNKTEIPGDFVSAKEYEEVLSMLNEFGIDDGYCQELVTGSDWLPDFTKPNPFSSELSRTVWHY